MGRYTVKTVLLYQIDLTTQHRSNSARLFLGKGNIIFNEKLKTNHCKMDLLY